MYLQQTKGCIYNGIELMIMENKEGEEYVIICEEGHNDKFIIEKKEALIHELPKKD